MTEDDSITCYYIVHLASTRPHILSLFSKLSFLNFACFHSFFSRYILLFFFLNFSKRTFGSQTTRCINICWSRNTPFPCYIIVIINCYCFTTTKSGLLSLTSMQLSKQNCSLFTFVCHMNVPYSPQGTVNYGSTHPTLQGKKFFFDSDHIILLFFTYTISSNVCGLVHLTENTMLVSVICSMSSDNQWLGRGSPASFIF